MLGVGPRSSHDQDVDTDISGTKISDKNNNKPPISHFFVHFGTRWISKVLHPASAILVSAATLTTTQSIQQVNNQQYSQSYC